jgi:hypothetical protein
MAIVEFHRQWIEQCEAARDIKRRFGLPDALEYLIGEKLLRFVDASEQLPDFRRELPHFLAEIQCVFSFAEIDSYASQIERKGRLSPPQRAAVQAVSSRQIH